MNLNALHAELAKIDRRRTQLQERISKEAKSLYASLPAKVGLRTVDALILALSPYASPFIRGKLSHSKRPSNKSSASTAQSTSQRSAKSTKRPPVRSDAQKTAVREAFKGGKLTTREISNQYKVPFNTLKKWKTAWGLTAAPHKKKK